MDDLNLKILDDKYILSSLSNALDIITLLGTADCMGISDIGRKLNLGKSSVFRMLYTLERKGFVQKNSNAKYSLGLKLAYLGNVVADRENKCSAIRYTLNELVDKTNKAVHISVLSTNCSMIFIEGAYGNMMFQFRTRLGIKYPAYCSGGGKILLSFLLDKQNQNHIYNIELHARTKNTITDHHNLIKELIQIKQTGYAIDNEESEEGLICYGVPIFDKNGKGISALSMYGYTQSMIENKDYYIKLLKESAHEIETYTDILSQYSGSDIS